MSYIKRANPLQKSNKTETKIDLGYSSLDVQHYQSKTRGKLNTIKQSPEIFIRAKYFFQANVTFLASVFI